MGKKILITEHTLMNSILNIEIMMNILVMQKDYYFRILKNMIHYYTFIKKLLY